MKKETKTFLKYVKHRDEFYELLRWLRKNKIYNCEIYEENNTFSIDVHDSVCLVGDHSDLPYKFNKIKGSFTCINVGLENSKNLPNKADKVFLRNNKLTQIDLSNKEYNYLDISFNHLEELIIDESANIKTILAKSNNLVKVHINNENIKKLNLKYNNIHDFHNNSNHNIMYLYLSHNKIKNFIINNNNRDCYINLKNNLVSTLDFNNSQPVNIIAKNSKLNNIKKVINDIEKQEQKTTLYCSFKVLDKKCSFSIFYKKELLNEDFSKVKVICSSDNQKLFEYNNAIEEQKILSKEVENNLNKKTYKSL